MDAPFFEPPELIGPPELPPRPPWLGSPDNVVGGAVPLDDDGGGWTHVRRITEVRPDTRPERDR